MIKTFKHKGLKGLYENNTVKGINPQQKKRITRILSYLDSATSINDLNLPGFKLHQLKGDLNNYWSITVTGNYRIIFTFNNSEISDIDYIDYH